MNWVWLLVLYPIEYPILIVSIVFNRNQMEASVTANIRHQDFSPTQPIERMASRPEVLRIIGIKSPTTLYNLIRHAGFPSPYEISAGRKCWAMSEVQAWLASKMAAQCKATENRRTADDRQI